ncbi:MAG: hypothetical protein KQI35_17830 [Bacteroidetes bacterium]|nr:hypothetical protein [Bacteroidota bacterium]
MKSVLLNFVVLFLLYGSCNQMQSNQQDMDSPGYTLLLNGAVIQVDPGLYHQVDSVIRETLESCDDLYEQIVMPSFIDDLKQADYLELIYDEPININLMQGGDLIVSKILIPLSGKFRNNNELTFICGSPEYSSPPYVNSKGYDQLEPLLNKMKP